MTRKRISYNTLLRIKKKAKGTSSPLRLTYKTVRVLYRLEHILNKVIDSFEEPERYSLRAENTIFRC